MEIYLKEISETHTSNPYLIIDSKGKVRLDIAKLVKDLLAEFNFKTYLDTDEVLVFQSGYYQKNGEKFIRSECQRRVGINAALTEHGINEVVGHIKRSTYTERDNFNQDKVIVNVKNGLLNTETRELKPHSANFLSTIRIPITYNPETKAIRIRQFISEVHHPEDIPVIQEVFGNCLVHDNSIQKAVLYIGDGENGKSTELNLLKAFIGKTNCSSVSWQQLELNRFAKSSLEGKLVNIFADLPSQSMNMTTAFKMLTGGDSIGAEKKFKDEYSFVNYAKLIFSANKPPKVTDEDSYAFWRRWILVEFPNQFGDDKKDPEIIDKLTTEVELSGLLNWALEGLSRLRQQKKYSYIKTVDQTTEYYMRASDPVYAFLQDKCKADSEYCEDKDELHSIFEKYCKEKNLPGLKPNAFARALQNQTLIKVKSYRPEVQKGDKKVRITAWMGIRVITEDEDGVQDN